MMAAALGAGSATTREARILRVIIQRTMVRHITAAGVRITEEVLMAAGAMAVSEVVDMMGAAVSVADIIKLLRREG